MNKFLSALTDASNLTQTENGGGAFRSTKSAVLDFFSLGGAIRGISESEQVSMLARAYNENPELAIRSMFYFRDIRAGQGQRDPFRNQLRWLAGVSPNTVRRNLHLVPHFGRWDDLFVLFGTSLEDDVLQLIADQLSEDVRDFEAGKQFSLLAKWMKSENASSQETREIARKTRVALGMSPKTYRKTLSRLRGGLNVVEKLISEGSWGEIDYSKVPSNAMLRYRKAFARNDGPRFTGFLEAVNSGEAKINASTLYPHDIISKILVNSITGQQAQAMWNALPDFCDEAENSIAVVDTSGSMYDGLSINVALSLGIYIAERAKGPFKDHFLTFSERPTLQKIQGNNIVSKVKSLQSAHWGFSTNIQAVFNRILNVAIENNLRQDELVQKVYIVSDMEFDSAVSSGSKTVFETIRKDFKSAGYEMPLLVFWRVNVRSPQVPMMVDSRGFQNVSGFSPSILKSLMANQSCSAYELMLDVLGGERYDCIQF